MFDSYQRLTGTQDAATIALLAGAVIFNPVVLALSHSSTYASFWLAFACSAWCMAMVWLNSKERSRLAIPSVETGFARAK